MTKVNLNELGLCENQFSTSGCLGKLLLTFFKLFSIFTVHNWNLSQYLCAISVVVIANCTAVQESSIILLKSYSLCLTLNELVCCCCGRGRAENAGLANDGPKSSLEKQRDMATSHFARSVAFSAVLFGPSFSNPAFSSVLSCQRRVDSCPQSRRAYDEVMRHRRSTRRAVLRWQFIASGAGLDGDCQGDVYDVTPVGSRRR